MFLGAEKHANFLRFIFGEVLIELTIPRNQSGIKVAVADPLRKKDKYGDPSLRSG
jgi:hypothetical protein